MRGRELVGVRRGGVGIALQGAALQGAALQAPPAPLVMPGMSAMLEVAVVGVASRASRLSAHIINAKKPITAIPRPSSSTATIQKLPESEPGACGWCEE